MTIQQMLLGVSGSTDLGYTDWGGGQPAWNTSYTTYSINSPSYSGLNIGGHYGMTTDSFHRYLIFTNRFSNSDYTIFVPIEANGSPNFTNRFGVMPVYDNYFGACVDTVRGRIYHTPYSSGARLRGQDLPSTLTGLSAGGYANISGNTRYTLASENAPNLDYPVGPPCDGGYHDGWNDMYYFTDRSSARVYSYNPNTASWTNLGTGSGNGKYGICRDPSSNYFVYARREPGWRMINGLVGADINTYSNASNTSGFEDVVITWNGDLWGWVGTGQSVYRFTRTA